MNNLKAVSNVLVIGSSNVDQIIFSDHLPKPGETVSMGRYVQVYGGKGANQAVAASKAGAEVTMISSLGDDSYGNEILKNLQQFGVNTSFVKRQNGIHTGVALIVVDAKGENSIAVALGANNLLSFEMVEEVVSGFEMPFGFALLQMEAPLETVCKTIELLHNKGIEVVLNLAPFFNLPADVLAKVSYLVVNTSEAEELAFFPVSNQHSAEQAAKAIYYQSGIPNIVVTLGGDGVVLSENGVCTFFPVVNVEVVDTTAAGDVFCGYLVAGLSVQLSLLESIEQAIVASAISVTRQGAQPSIPEKEEVEEWILKLKSESFFKS